VLEIQFLQFVLVLSVFACMYKLEYVRYCFSLVLLCPQVHALYYVDANGSQWKFPNKIRNITKKYAWKIFKQDRWSQLLNIRHCYFVCVDFKQLLY